MSDYMYLKSGLPGQVTSAAFAANPEIIQGADLTRPSPECACNVDTLTEVLATKLGAPIPQDFYELLVGECLSMGTKEFQAKYLDQAIVCEQAGGTNCMVGELKSGFEGCKPWYLRRMTWMVGGAAALAAAVLWKVLR